MNENEMNVEELKLLVRRLHNEQAFTHPDSEEYRELQALCSKYAKLAHAMERDER